MRKNKKLGCELVHMERREGQPRGPDGHGDTARGLPGTPDAGAGGGGGVADEVREWRSGR